ncbi:fasciclin domain-containing protein [Chitinophaga sp. ARDCPP14]|uniref:fasciclin domain-containing protein n=1 Tax=Chitinophaga sp. ARDCPP14 TaxID=3391139 RepID=UPI003F51E062
MKRIYINLLVILLFSACSKDPIVQEDIYNTRGIAAVANNNFNLTLFAMAMQSSGYTAILSQRGPFTVLAPSNAAFNLMNIRNAVDIRNASGLLSEIIPYHVINQQISFDTLGISTVHTFLMDNGLPVYISRRENSRDTAITVNGVRLPGNALPTPNGNMYLLDQVLLPSTSGNVQEVVGNESTLTFFNAAVMRSGLYKILTSSDIFTVFAPSNQAFVNVGITTTDSIYRMDPALLEHLLKAHITTGRRFINDYIFMADVATDNYTETMIDNGDIQMQLLPMPGAPGRFRSIRLSRLNNSTGMLWSASLVKENLAASNGVVHIVDNIFVP